jgi:hypothetical protein
MASSGGIPQGAGIVAEEAVQVAKLVLLVWTCRHGDDEACNTDCGFGGGASICIDDDGGDSGDKDGCRSSQERKERRVASSSRSLRPQPCSTSARPFAYNLQAGRVVVTGWVCAVPEGSLGAKIVVPKGLSA